MIYPVLVLLGLCFGSFVNAFVWRLHELENGKLSNKQKKELSVVRGRSMCVHCHHELAWYDLLPVLSWISLRGKCRYCGKSISAQYPAIELLMSALFVGSYLGWPYDFTPVGWLLFGLWLVFVVCFVALAVYDLRWMELPNKIIYPLTGLAIVQVFFRGVAVDDLAGSIIGAFLGFLVIGGLFYGLFQVSGGKWIGGGDVKLSFMIGPLVGGALSGVMVIFLASVLGTLVSLPLMAKKSLRVTSRIPFGPFLLVATMIAYLYGDRIIDWYTKGLI